MLTKEVGMTRPVGAVKPGRAEIDRHLLFAEAALALGGHEVEDPALRAIIGRAARRELTGDEAIAAIRRRVQG
ncbi:MULTISPECIES: hypothetical protein [unclassified Rathayibacter]|uniref:hypothetical protein n=1 Tax=unclassified Rathayibacter TaxID=2609250 RepID=UPI001FB2E0A9|nr:MULTISPECIES: hypothetical protein [unclassified Rathayibacter]MCJ1674859.1 hypothetical protein [Rathayibacter sp. VKM Ac-2929]MCJ1683690.1 hypothetical protein [Rathayibacter sp. VKM Ac-2928]MCJ1686424.1 hypothetical protein [Rathayibacter sp. VKM Ac-2927]